MRISLGKIIPFTFEKLSDPTTIERPISYPHIKINVHLLSMKATILVGSAQKGGNTDEQCRAIADALEENGFDVCVVYPFNMNIKHCDGCNKCMISGSCHIDDDMKTIYDLFDDSDLFVISTPVYFSSLSSIIKQVIDRFQCRWASIDDPLVSKYIALICNGGSRNPRFENIISVARTFAFGTRRIWAGECLVDSTDLIDVSKLAKEAYKFGFILANKILGK
ncbi:MAG: flavodoxin family protein [archaeon]|nr:flavodoxin family protein [archaeon]